MEAAGSDIGALLRGHDTLDTVVDEDCQDADRAAISKKDEPLEAPSNSDIGAIGSIEKTLEQKVDNGPANVGHQKIAVPRSSNYHGVTRQMKGRECLF